MADFTFKTYRFLLSKLIEQGFNFQTFEDFMRNPKDKSIILRHDIDIKKGSSVIFAKIENELGVKGTYYYRAVPYVFDKKIVKSVSDLGHEIGYHYESLSMYKGNYEKAISDFKLQLEKFRSVVHINTICMHGDSRSKHDNKEMWERFSYRDYGIIGEPYFDLDFNKVLYLTNSAQRWNGHKIAVRDKVKSNLKFDFTTTFDIINNITTLPNQVMFTIHPDRWTDNPLEWMRVNSLVKIKNFIKVHYLSKRAKAIIK